MTYREAFFLTQSIVNDVFHTGSPDSTLWEFKHGGGSFKRGDLVGLRDIKRRASRHALIHRDSFSGTKSAGPSVPGTPNEQPGDSIESRMMSVEGALFEINQRLARTEENNAMLSNRCQTAIEGLTRCHQVSSEIFGFCFVVSDILSFPLNFTWCWSYSYLPLDLLNPFSFLPVSSGVRLAHTYIVDN